ncbi:MAG: hypothetical protein KF844_09120 [Cryobacterium sp.]|nr:hypothetical protein [Cryobacterium sp.]
MKHPDSNKESGDSSAIRPKRHRRVRTKAASGSDPEPGQSNARLSERENDERLKADKPPHWG